MKKTLLVIGFLLGVIGLVLAFTPLKMMSLIPSGTGILLGLLSLLMRKGGWNKMTWVVLFISVIAILVGTLSITIIEDEVAEDKENNEKIEKVTKEAEENLDSALMELE